MRHPFFTRMGRPLVFAHRGGAGLAPENTLAAFDHGLELGADGLELDVRLSSDGRVVVMHDEALDRTTNLSGPVAMRTADELGRADAGYRYHRGNAADGYPFRGCGIGVPTLQEVLDRYPNVPIIVELKVNAAELAHAAVEVVRRAHAVNRICFGSSRRRVLQEVRQLEPTVATSAAREEVRLALYRSWLRIFPRRSSRLPYAGFQVPEQSGSTRVVTPRFVEDAHAAGLGVQVWTVDDPTDATRLIEWGVDALITDRPDVIVPLARESQVDRT